MQHVTPGIHRERLTFELNFTQIPNDWLRDKRISFKSKGLLAYLLSHEVGYNITLGQIERETNDGRAAIRSAIDELEAAGYLKTETTKDANGYNSGLAYFIQEPKCENPTLENPTLENRTAYREQKDIKNKTNKETYGHFFEKFWELYPRKTGKAAAERAWRKATVNHDPGDILQGADRLANDPNLPPKQYIPHPATWLNDGRWDDEPYPARKLTGSELEAKNQKNIEEYLKKHATN